MTGRVVLDARWQYATVQEAMGADQWLATWLQLHGANVRPAGTFHAPMAVIPATPGTPANDTDPATPACNGQLSCVVHVEAADVDAATVLAQQVNTALGTIVAEGGVFDCYGDSQASITNE